MDPYQTQNSNSFSIDYERFTELAKEIQELTKREEDNSEKHQSHNYGNNRPRSDK